LVSRLRSRSLTELTRQIAPPTKNGHAPPPIESRKSSQSVNPYYVWTCGVLKATSADPWSASFMVETRTACFEHSNFFKVTAPEKRPGQLRPGAHRWQKGRADRCTPTADRSAQPKGRNLNDASPAQGPCDPTSYHESSKQQAGPALTFYLINASLPEVGVCCTY
ncbi:hypothetical protein HN51_025374, partial [Arachis hypogaea]